MQNWQHFQEWIAMAAPIGRAAFGDFFTRLALAIFVPGLIAMLTTYAALKVHEAKIEFIFDRVNRLEEQIHRLQESGYHSGSGFTYRDKNYLRGYEDPRDLRMLQSEP
jgi:hypothetical protein